MNFRLSRQPAGICLLSVSLLSLTAVFCCRSMDKPVWHWNLESRSYAQPAVDGKTVYVVSEAAEVVAGTWATGTKLWSKKLGEEPIFGRPTVLGETLFIGTERGNLYALNKHTGAELWHKNFPGDSFVSEANTFESLLILPSRSGRLYAVNSQSGETVWSFVDAKVLMAGPIIRDPYVLIGGWDKSMDCLDVRTGAVKWRFRIDEPVVQEAILYKNSVIFSGHEKALWAVDLASGRFLWKRAGYLHSDPIIFKDQVIVGIRELLQVLNPNSGAILTQFKMREPIGTLYNVENECLMLHDKRLYKIDLEKQRFEILLSAPQSLFKVAFAPGMYIAADELYGIWGFGHE